MSTSSSIAILNKNGVVEQVSCHYDGHVHNNGAILLIHYRDVEKVRDLITLGTISSLKKNVHPSANSNHSFRNREEDVTTFYGRDRGDLAQNSRKFKSERDFLTVGISDNFNYLFNEKNKKWFFIGLIPIDYSKDSDPISPKVKILPLENLVKAEFQKMQSSLRDDFLLYEKEIQTKKDYEKLSVDLLNPSEENNPTKKLKI